MDYQKTTRVMVRDLEAAQRKQRVKEILLAFGVLVGFAALLGGLALLVAWAEGGVP